MTDTKPSLDEQIAFIRPFITGIHHGERFESILASLEELKRIKELLREPSEEMCIKGDETGMFMCGDDCCHDHSDCAETVWGSMSAALLAQVSKDINDE